MKGRQFDYPFGVNLDYAPRSRAAFASPNCARSPTRCRCCAPSSRPARTRSPATNYAVRSRRADLPAAAALEAGARAFSPAPTGVIRSRPGCGCCSRTCSSSTRRRSIRASARRRALRARQHRRRDHQAVIDEDGRAPEPPDPAYQQVLKGVPAADFSAARSSTGRAMCAPTGSTVFARWSRSR